MSQIIFEKAVLNLSFAIKWLAEHESGTERIYANTFNTFIKMRLFSAHVKVRATYDAFVANTKDLKLIGKMELWLEIISEDKKGFLEELTKKNADIERVIQQIDEKNKKTVAAKKPVAKPVATNSSPKPTKESTIIIVLAYYDSTEYGEHAVRNAAIYASQTGKKLTIIGFFSGGKDRVITSRAMYKLSEEINKKYSFEPTLKLMANSSNYTKDILNLTESIEAKFLFIGSKGFTKGLHFIANASIPCVIVQNAPNRDKLSNVLFPVDDRPAIKQKLAQARILGEFYRPVFHLSYPNKITIQAIRDRVERNLSFVKAYLREQGIEIQEQPVETSSALDATLTKLKELTPDLIVILPKKSLGLSGYSLGSDEKKIISKAGTTPVLCANMIHGKVSGYTTGVMY